MSADLPPGVTLRPATPADLGDVERLLVASRLPVGAVRAQIRDFFVAETPEGVVGAIGLEWLGTDALLRAACVRDDWRGRGIATALVERVLTEAALEALDFVYLVTPAADRFFARFGFMRIPEDDLPLTVIRALGRDGPRDPGAIPMRLQLAER